MEFNSGFKGLNNNTQLQKKMLPLFQDGSMEACVGGQMGGRTDDI